MSKLVLFLALVLTASAQEPAAAPAAVEPLVAAIRLPVVAAELRDDGVPDADVKSALKAAQDKKIPAAETTEVLTAADEAVEEHGPVDNFGAFVQTQLDAGLRGQELAAAIRAEHQAHGKGKGVGKKEKGAAGEHGKPEGEHGKAGEHGKEADHGKAGEHGKPEDKGGKPEDKGGKPETKGH